MSRASKRPSLTAGPGVRIRFPEESANVCPARMAMYPGPKPGDESSQRTPFSRGTGSSNPSPSSPSSGESPANREP
jgi:hypothetical protein